MKDRPNERIGFNDKWLMVLLIPTLSFIIPIVFFGVRFHGVNNYTWDIYLPAFITTLVLWIGNRYIMIWARNRYPDFTTVRKRLIVQSLMMLVYTLIINNSICFILRGLMHLNSNPFPGQTVSDILISTNSTSLFCTLAITAIYESRYFMSELKKSVEEKEMLKRESLHAQLDALRTQINPHFLFNNLNTLTAIIPEEPETAVKFVQQLSKVYRHILEVKDEQSISLRNELTVLNSYAFLLQTRFGTNLKIQVDIDESEMSQKVVPLSLQLLMENAIKHNIVSEDHPLYIHIYTENGKLVVSNNLQRKKQVTESIGFGLENIQKRYKLLTDHLVDIVPGPEKFTVSIPLIER